MTDPIVWATVSSASLIGLVVVATTTLKGWRDWLALQRLAIDGRRADDCGSPPANARIELADLKERVRKLEAIAAGVDL